MIIAPLCSSSAANSAFIGSGNSGILIDAGCSYKQLRHFLALCGTDVSAVKAVLITHEHIDHVRGLKQFTKHTDVPVYMTAGTREAVTAQGLVYKEDNIYDVSELKNAPVDYEIKAFATPHDSMQSAGYSVTDGKGYKIAFITDLGEVTPEVRENAAGSDFVFIEANYDPIMLKNNAKYPAYIKARIASRRGHLSNADSARYISELVGAGTTRLVLGHLSRENNTPEIAYKNTVEVLTESGKKAGYDYTLDVAGVCNTDGYYIAV